MRRAVMAVELDDPTQKQRKGVKYVSQKHSVRG